MKLRRDDPFLLAGLGFAAAAAVLAARAAPVGEGAPAPQARSTPRSAPRLAPPPAGW